MLGKKVAQKQIRASRCFKIEFADQDDKENTKWLFGSIDQQHNGVHQAREIPALKQLNLDLDYDLAQGALHGKQSPGWPLPKFKAVAGWPLLVTSACSPALSSRAGRLDLSRFFLMRTIPAQMITYQFFSLDPFLPIR